MESSNFFLYIYRHLRIYLFDLLRTYLPRLSQLQS